MNRQKFLIAVLLLGTALMLEAQSKPSDATFSLNWTAHPAYSLIGSDPKRVEY
jgi:hypothetical protein